MKLKELSVNEDLVVVESIYLEPPAAAFVIDEDIADDEAGGKI